MHAPRILTVLILVAAVGIGGHAADLRSVAPVTDTILDLHVDEGHIDQGIDESAARAYIAKLDTTAASDVAAYTVTSEDDPAFTSGLRPTRVGRKAKAADTLSKFRPEQFVLDHRIYLVLPRALRRGCTYTVRSSALGGGEQSRTFLFHEPTLRSETLHVGQAGFTPDGPKFAYLSHWMGDLGGLELDAFTGRPFRIVRVVDQAVVFSGKVEARKDAETGAPQTSSNLDGTPYNGAKGQAVAKNFTGADVSQCDFSAFAAPGEYRVVVDGIGCSFPFAIDADAYRRAYRLASRGIFFQRSGIEKEIEPGQSSPRDYHPADKRNAFQYDANWRFIDTPNHEHPVTATGTLAVWGWYHDAGDWDGYPSHGLVPMSLLLLYDLAPEKFADGQVANRYKSNADGSWIEEGSNGVPDLLDEAAWLVEYYRRARAVGMEAGLTTGGVPGGYAGVDTCAGGASWKDTRALKFSAEDPQMTYQYAACAAWLATCLDKAGKRNAAASAGWLAEAKAAYGWAKENTRPGDDGKILGSRMLASLCLYRATKDVAYHAPFAADMAQDGSFQGAEEGWAGPNPWELAAGVYALLPAGFPALDAALQQSFKDKVLAAVERDFIKPASERGYRVGFDWSKIHGIGMSSTPMLYLPAVAYEITEDRKYLDLMHTSAAYFLGGNPMSAAWMTGFGQRAVKYPFHPNSWALIDYDSMVYENENLPGYVPYGSCESVDFFGPGHHFTGDEDFSRSSAYPDVESWPLSETRFENRYSIPAGEFCIQQTMAPSVFAYGYLCGDASDKPIDAPARPTVAVTFPKDGDAFAAGGDVALRVDASASVRRVEYYRNERFIGESTASPFAFTWRGAPAGSWLLTAKAFDDRGQVSRPNDPAADVDARITVDAAAPRVAMEKLAIVDAPRKPLRIDATATLCASATPLGATDQSLTWASSDTAVASVNSQGVVVAKSAGTATITVTSIAGKLSASCQITVEKIRN
ncbi:MAG TPA: glycoside hydrolase family 9 protein [Planctomycetota bacterium]|nr:glycoside hydrolase family 9 protein [Planctomycetota bacterium]